MKKAVIIMILICCCILTACGSTEINKTLYVSSAGISFVKDVYCISVSGKAASENGAKVITAVGRGRTAAQALEKASESSGLAIFFGHCTRITADCGALRNSGLLGELSESVISPSCRVYYSDEPCENGGNCRCKLACMRSGSDVFIWRPAVQREIRRISSLQGSSASWS